MGMVKTVTLGWTGDLVASDVVRQGKNLVAVTATTLTVDGKARKDGKGKTTPLILTLAQYSILDRLLRDPKVRAARSVRVELPSRGRPPVARRIVGGVAPVTTPAPSRKGGKAGAA